MSNGSDSTENREGRLSLIWGAKSIAEELGIDPRRAYYLLEGGMLPGARKVGRSWVADRATLHRQFTGEAES